MNEKGGATSPCGEDGCELCTAESMTLTTLDMCAQPPLGIIAAFEDNFGRGMMEDTIEQALGFGHVELDRGVLRLTWLGSLRLASLNALQA